MSKIGLSLGLITLALLIGFAAYVRLAPSDPAVWHVDPLTVRPPDKPNYDLVGPEDGGRNDQVFDMPPQELMDRLNAIALATPRVRVLAGSAADGFVTYIARSKVWGFPDYISVKAVPAEGGARLAAFSRARFGQSDMGVNAARMEDWVQQLDRQSHASDLAPT